MKNKIWEYKAKRQVVHALGETACRTTEETERAVVQAGRAGRRVVACVVVRVFRLSFACVTEAT